MKIKKIISLCKQTGHVIIYDDEAGGIQWLSDGTAIYPLHGLPHFDEETFFRTFDFSEKQKSKMTFIHRNALPETICTDDYTLSEKECVRQYALVTGEGELMPYHTTQGIKFILWRHIAPLADSEALTVCERVTPGGELYFVIKSGFILLGIVSPYAAITKDFVEQLRNFSRECEKAFEEKQEKDAEQARMF